MRKFLLLIMLLGMVCFVKGQIATDFYWIQFADKANSPYTIDNPEAFLSQRALQRRANQGIAIDEYDLPVNPQYLQEVADCGAELLNPSKWLNGVTVRITDLSVLDAVAALDFVVAARNCMNYPEAQMLKEKWLQNEMQMKENQSKVLDFYGGGSVQITQLNGVCLHDSGYLGEGMVIAVLDGGFSGADTHPAFDNMREEGRLMGTREFVYGCSTVYSQSTHGTSCLSTMAAYVPNTFVGTAPKASYYLIHTEDARQENIIEEYNWVSGAEYADSLGVDVCSTSLGYVDFDLSQWNHSFEHFDGHTAPMTIGAEIAASRGMICLNSAGNDGDSWNGECTIGIPADAESILSIGAVNGDGNRANFSSVGPTYDGRIKPDVMSMGEGTFVANGNNGGYYNGNGTSFSCPVMAGMVTCLWQANPLATAAEIRDIVRNCSDRASNPDNNYGYGIPNFELAMNMLPVHEISTETDELVNVYPNPSNGNVCVVLKEGVQAEIRVSDYIGRQLFSYHFNGLNHTTLETRINELSAGIYFVNAQSELGNQMIKLLKTN